MILLAWYLWSYDDTAWRYVNGFDTKQECIIAKAERTNFKCRPAGTFYLYLG